MYSSFTTHKTKSSLKINAAPDFTAKINGMRTLDSHATSFIAY